MSMNLALLDIGYTIKLLSNTSDCNQIYNNTVGKITKIDVDRVYVLVSKCPDFPEEIEKEINFTIGRKYWRFEILEKEGWNT